VQSLKELFDRDSKVAANVAKEVFAKIKTSKIHVPLENDKTPVSTDRTKVDFWQLSYFITTASELNRKAKRDGEKKINPLFSDAEMKELVELTAGNYLSARNPVSTSISQIMTEVVRYAPQMAQQIRVKIGASNAQQLDKLLESQSYYISRNEKSLDELVKDAEISAPELRDQRFADAALKAIEEGDAEKAQTIAARIKQRKNFEYLDEQIEDALPLSKARRGDLSEVRKILATMKENSEKIAILTELATAMAMKGDKEAAKKLLDEAMSMMPAGVKNYSEIDSAVKIASVYAVAAPDSAFLIIESGILQSDEFINAGVKMDEFYISGSTKENELLFSSINRQFLTNVPNATGLIRDLSRADFDRLIDLAEKFQRPEIRLFVKLKILQALLDAKSAEKEKMSREELAGDDEG